MSYAQEDFPRLVSRADEEMRRWRQDWSLSSSAPVEKGPLDTRCDHLSDSESASARDEILAAEWRYIMWLCVMCRLGVGKGRPRYETCGLLLDQELNSLLALILTPSQLLSFGRTSR